LSADGSESVLAHGETFSMDVFVVEHESIIWEVVLLVGSESAVSGWDKSKAAVSVLRVLVISN